MYKFEFGVFKPGEYFDEEKRIRLFTPVISETLPRDEMISRISALVYGWRPEMFDNWVHTNEKPCTFKVGHDYGYRITQV